MPKTGLAAEVMAQITYRRTSFAAVLTLLVAIAGVLAGPGIPKASALSGSDFNAGSIISDSDFYNPNAMSQAEIQTFLDSHIGTCTNGQCLNVLTTTVASRPRVVSDSTGNVRCEAFMGGTLSAAAIIYRAQVACGVSAKVILVTLQKEQGLVSKSAPSQAALDRAMGFACPDTAPCAALSLGFGNQVYTGTLQLKTYKASNFGVQPGIRNVLYSPNGSCGSSSVNIENYATAALYNYTPYQPNAAALVNLTGVGDGCSSYGNRNFWVYYNGWFGASFSPAAGPIGDLWTSLGGDAGPMDSAQGGLESFSGGGGGTGQRFLNGSIMSSAGGRTVALMNGPLRTAYFAGGGPSGPLGWPADPVTTFGGGAGGIGQRFDFGSLMYANSSQLPIAIFNGPLRDAYFASGGPTGPLGWPVDASQSFPGGVQQQFQTASFLASQSGVFKIFSGSIQDQYSKLGGPSSAIGWPTGEQVCVGASCSQRFQGGTLQTDPIAALYQTLGGYRGALGMQVGGVQIFTGSGSGQGVRYVNGSIMSSPVAGTFAIMNGSIRDQYFARGGPASPMGWPTAAQVCVGLSCSQLFQGGTISTDPIEALHESLGGDSGVLGPVQSGPQVFTGSGGGVGRRYLNGSIMSSSIAGTFAIMNGSIRDQYFGMGGPANSIGWPTAAQACSGSLCSQKFQGGTIATDAMAALQASLGGDSGVLGPVQSGIQAFTGSGGGLGRRYLHGSIMSSAGATVAIIDVPIRDQYFLSGGPSGPLGWPVAPAQTFVGGSGQRFQNGSLMALSSARLAVPVLNGAIRDTYFATGGPSGDLGWPMSGLETFSGTGGGVGQRFQNGSMMSSSAAGTFQILNGLIRNTYFSAGGPSSGWGWPNSTQTCVASNCSQRFQGGTISG